MYAKSNGKKQNDVSHILAGKSQKAEDLWKLTLGERQNHEGVTHSISRVEHWGKMNLWHNQVQQPLGRWLAAKHSFHEAHD